MGRRRRPRWTRPCLGRCRHREKHAVLTTRLAHLLHTGRAWPNQILTVTFTNKAARRCASVSPVWLDGRSKAGGWATFHALAARLLRRHAELVGLKSNFTILDTDDQIRLMKQVMEANSIDGKRWPARLILSTVGSLEGPGANTGQADRRRCRRCGRRTNGRALQGVSGPVADAECL